MTRALLVPVVLALTGTACMHASRAAPAAASEPAAATTRPSSDAPMGGGMAGMCPMSVPGTQVSAAEISTGEALTFTTSPDQAAALREKVHAMADMHNSHHASGDAGHGGMGDMMGHGGMGAGGMEGMQMPPPSRAAVEDLPDGARLLVTPNDPADLKQLQSTVRKHAEHMQQDGCGMMDHSQHGAR